MRRPRILVVEDNNALAQSTKRILEEEGFAADAADDFASAVKLLDEYRYEVVVVDMKLPDGNGIDILEELKKRSLDTSVIVTTAYATIGSSVDAMKRGAEDYLAKPFTGDELLVSVKRVMDKRAVVKENVKLRGQLQAQYAFENIIGESGEMRRIYQLITKASSTDVNVIIYGESGTGKELVARAIHYNSRRAGHRFVVINCSAIPESLLESEFFGYKKGSFTGAYYDKLGLFEVADKGTIFLDEIGDISQTVQVKLLRTLQEREITPVGSTESKKIDVRLISATHRDLQKMVKDEKFRDDLYFRLHVLPIYLPPLRHRKSDIPLLTAHLLKKYSEQLGKRVRGFSKDALARMTDYDWPGNVRELENFVQQMVAMHDKEIIHSADLPEDFNITEETIVQKGKQSAVRRTGLTLKDYLKRIERARIVEVLRQAHGQRTRAAEILKIDRKTLYQKIKEHNIREDFE
jgi:DNA-binding NtrC family response regulator